MKRPNLLLEKEKDTLIYPEEAATIYIEGLSFGDFEIPFLIGGGRSSYNDLFQRGFQTIAEG